MNTRRALQHLTRCDPVLARVIAEVGPLRPAFREPTFEAMARSIVYQQLHGKAARTIFDRLAAAAGGELTPASLLALSEAEMRACGLSRQKLAYLRDLAARTQSGEVDFAALPRMSDAEVIAHLTRVKGIGLWSAQMFLMFALRRPDVLPTGDFGIQAAVRRHWRKRKHPKPAEVAKLGKRWSPYATLACYYLWRSLDGARPPAAKRAKQRR